jgi:ketosteroid isomerase-like protein
MTWRRAFTPASATGAFVLVMVALRCVAPAGAQEFKGQAPPETPPSVEEQELIQLERAWDGAFVAKDMRFIERVLADEFVATYADGTRGDKAAEMAQTLDFDQRVDSSVLDSFRVRLYGDTAVVWFSRHMTGPKAGKIVSVTFRFVDVFVKRGGRWQCVSSQSTRVGV